MENNETGVESKMKRNNQKQKMQKQVRRGTKREFVAEQDFMGTSARMLLGILTGLCNFSGINPLAPSFFMAVGGKLMEKVVLFICIIGGIFIRLGTEQAIRYACIMGTAYIIDKMMEGLHIESIHKKAGIIGIVIAGVTLIRLLWTIDDGNVILSAVTEGAICTGLVILVNKAMEYENHRHEKIEQEELMGWILLCAGILYGVAIPNEWELLIKQGAVLFCILYSSYRFGMAEGTLFGMILGGTLYYCGYPMESLFQGIALYALFGIGSGILRKAGRLGSMLGMAFVFGIFLWETNGWESGAWKGLVLSMTFFLALPRTFLLQAKPQQKSESMEEMIWLQTRNQLRDFSEAFRRIRTTLVSVPEQWQGEQQRQKILEHTVQKVCQGCEYNGYCWDKEARLAYQEAGAVLELAEQNGTIENLSEYPFFSHCLKQEAFSAEIRHGYEMNKLEMLYNERIIEGREAMAGQFQQISNMIEDLFHVTHESVVIPQKVQMRIVEELKKNHVQISEILGVENQEGRKEIYVTVHSEKGRMLTVRELARCLSKALGYRVRSKSGNRTIVGKVSQSYGFLEEADFYYLQGMAKVSRRREDISGDNFSILEYEPGKLGIMLADGMGSGQHANDKSELLIELLERLLEAGFSKDDSLRLLNSVLVTPISEANFSTLDLCMVDLYEGTCVFCKVGAASSFIKRGNQVEMIEGGAIPVGIFPNLEYNSYEWKIQDGDMIFLLSDGVMEAVPAVDKEKFIADEILKLDLLNPQEAATKLMARVQELGGRRNRDDITILTVGIWKRE